VLKKLWFKDIKLVFHEHGLIFGSENFSKTHDYFYKNLLKWFQKDINTFIAVSKATKQALLDIGIAEDKIQIVYNFIDLQKFDIKNISSDEVQAFHDRIGVDKNKFKIGFAARIVKTKGIVEFLNMAKRMLAQYQDIVFVIAGHGPLDDFINTEIRKAGLEKSIIHIGYKSNMPLFYKSLDCFVIPSYWESFGLTALEAQSMGATVIVSNIQGLDEVVNNGVDCIEFKVKDAEDLYNTVERVYKDAELRKNLQTNGFKNAQHFGLAQYVQDLEALYNNLYK
jgi:glycosyltransferase involved in cell wall biosynthesis